ncbi:lysophospholipid acyltransferase family protein [Chloroflexota bacterium]
MSWFYYIARTKIRVLLKLLTHCQVKGKENIPRQGPLLIVANHISLVDPPLLGVSLGRKVIFMAKKELFHSRVISYFMSILGAFPVHRKQLDRQAIRQAYQVLADGLPLVMFPEGTRSPNNRLLPALPGSALIALRSGAPILPVGIIGTEKIRGLTWLLHRPHIIVKIGHPFYLPQVSSKSAKTDLTELADFIMERIAELLPLEYRGDYGARKSDGIKD